MSVTALTRRSLLTGSVVAVVGAIAGFAVARGSGAASTTSPTAAANGYGPGPGSGGGTTPAVLVPLGQVTADGVIADGVVLTRTSSGGVHGVSATCTHQGCRVNPPVHGVVSCPCHGSRFDAATGKVLNGPATAPLPEVPVSVQGTDVVRS